MKIFITLLFIHVYLFADGCPENLFSGKDITAEGLYVSMNSNEAFEMATLIAMDALAKRVSKVFQEEITQMENETFSMDITTEYTTLLKQYEILYKEYDMKQHKAKVVLKIKNSVARSHLCNALQK
jgi:hypothetical protein